MKKLSAIVLTLLFSSMQISYAIDTNLGNINNVTGGYAGIDGANSNDVTLKFNGNSHVNWDTLNVGNGQSLNFNAINGANGLTVLNTVNRGMTTVAGQITANQGISSLILSNPNGVLMQGGKIETAGNLMLTTQDMSKYSVEDLSNIDYSKLDTNNAKIIMKDATIKVTAYAIQAEGFTTAAGAWTGASSAFTA